MSMELTSNPLRTTPLATTAAIFLKALTILPSCKHPAGFLRTAHITSACYV
jgi:hypothetical protein